MATMGYLPPGLRKYPLDIPASPGVRMRADLSASVFFPVLKYGCYPHQISGDLVVTSFLRLASPRCPGPQER